MKEAMNKKPELVELGKRLRYLRNSKKATQKKIANDLGIRPSVLSSYEVGDREPPLIMLNRISSYYNVTVDYLTGNSDSLTPEHKVLHNALEGSGLKSEVIDKLALLPSEVRSFLFDTLLMNDYFYDLITLMQYYSTCKHMIEPINDENIIKKATGGKLVEFFNKRKLSLYIANIFEIILDDPEMKDRFTKEEAEKYLLKMFYPEGSE